MSLLLAKKTEEGMSSISDRRRDRKAGDRQWRWGGRTVGWEGGEGGVGHSRTGRWRQWGGTPRVLATRADLGWPVGGRFIGGTASGGARSIVKRGGEAVLRGEVQMAGSVSDCRMPMHGEIRLACGRPDRVIGQQGGASPGWWGPGWRARKVACSDVCAVGVRGWEAGSGGIHGRGRHRGSPERGRMAVGWRHQ